MEGVNWTRVALGGFAAGVVSNVSGVLLAHLFLRSEIQATLERLKITFGLPVAVLHVAMRLAMGIAVVWLYAAIRPRFGPGPRTAFIAGTAMFIFSYAWSFLGLLPYRLYSPRLMLIAAAWGFLEINACALLGAFLYRET